MSDTIKILNTNGLTGIKYVMRQAIIIADQIYDRHGKKIVITCSSSGEHGAASYHYYGFAIDLRTNYFTKEEAVKVASDLRAALPEDYDVLLETDHIHLEFDVERYLLKYKTIDKLIILSI